MNNYTDTYHQLRIKIHVLFIIIQKEKKQT